MTNKKCVLPEQTGCSSDSVIRSGDRFTLSGVGQNKSGHMIRRLRADNKPPPFWGVNMKTGKRGRAVKLMVFKAVE